jgi:hypothetical protein
MLNNNIICIEVSTGQMYFSEAKFHEREKWRFQSECPYIRSPVVNPKCGLDY